MLVGAALERGAAMLAMTHDPAVARHAQRTISLHSGRLDVESA